MLGNTSSTAPHPQPRVLNFYALLVWFYGERKLYMTLGGGESIERLETMFSCAQVLMLLVWLSEKSSDSAYALCMTGDIRKT